MYIDSAFYSAYGSAMQFRILFLIEEIADKYQINMNRVALTAGTCYDDDHEECSCWVAPAKDSSGEFIHGVNNWKAVREKDIILNLHFSKTAKNLSIADLEFIIMHEMGHISDYFDGILEWKLIGVEWHNLFNKQIIPNLYASDDRGHAKYSSTPPELSANIFAISCGAKYPTNYALRIAYDIAMDYIMKEPVK